jgi:hypothetical protein
LIETEFGGDELMNAMMNEKFWKNSRGRSIPFVCQFQKVFSAKTIQSRDDSTLMSAVRFGPVGSNYRSATRCLINLFNP